MSLLCRSLMDKVVDMLVGVRRRCFSRQRRNCGGSAVAVHRPGVHSVAVGVYGGLAASEGVLGAFCAFFFALRPSGR